LLKSGWMRPIGSGHGSRQRLVSVRISASGPRGSEAESESNPTSSWRCVFGSRLHSQITNGIMTSLVQPSPYENHSAPPPLRTDHQVISDNGDYLYTSDLTSNQIIKIDADTGTIVGKVSVRNFPHGNHLHQIPSL